MATIKSPDELTDEERLAAMAQKPCPDLKHMISIISVGAMLSATYIALVKITDAVASGKLIEDEWYEITPNLDINIWYDEDRYFVALYEIIDGETQTHRHLRII
jgi:hypothetical protein